jgi:hypothetical protein
MFALLSILGDVCDLFVRGVLIISRGVCVLLLRYATCRNTSSSTMSRPSPPLRAAEIKSWAEIIGTGDAWRASERLPHGPAVLCKRAA